MKDLDEASFVLGIKIHQDKKGVLGLSYKAYLENVLKKLVYMHVILLVLL
jgi:hypothetical protein